ncbi:helix-turn-helix domain-containing protein [Sutcliffiella horikoshii]|uniref:helix-turn-helix domain-containing protein n=1 Tax=Sutcliffiella horikoshii TaxID=79883 RepID=UPI003CF23970
MKNEIFRAIRLYKGLSRKEFSKLLGVSESTVYFIESGERNVSDRVRMSLAKNFDITPEFLESVQRANKLAEQ